MWKKAIWIGLVLFFVLIGSWGLVSRTAPAAAQTPRGSTIGLIGFVGYVVDDVAVDSPAAKADIRQNDIIAYVGGRPVRSLESISDTFATTAPGASIEVKFLRYHPDVKKYSPHVVTLTTQERNPPGQTKWIYREPK